MGDERVQWFGEKILEQTNSVMAIISKKVSINVLKDAKKILKQKTSKKVPGQKKLYGTTVDGLLSQMYIEKSKFKTGGYIVWAQGPKKWKKPYHASFLEMGTYKDEAKPYMRPAISKNKNKANRMYQDAMDDMDKFLSGADVFDDSLEAFLA